MAETATPLTAAAHPEYAPAKDVFRYRCPLACGWTHDQPTTGGPVAIIPAHAYPADTSAGIRAVDPAVLSAGITAAAQDRAAATEQVIRDHLTGHSTEDWISALASARRHTTQLAQLAEDLTRFVGNLAADIAAAEDGLDRDEVGYFRNHLVSAGCEARLRLAEFASAPDDAPTPRDREGRPMLAALVDTLRRSGHQS